MSIVISPTRYTPADLLAMRDAKGVELIDGQLVEHEMGAKSCRIAARIIFLLSKYLENHSNGELMTSEVGYQCFPDAPGMVRKPDISFISAERYRPEYEKGFIPIAPDLAVEVVSPGDSYFEVSAKVDVYRRAGVKLLWVVNPEQQIVQVHTGRGLESELGTADEITGGDVLPEFRASVAKFFPPLTSLQSPE